MNEHSESSLSTSGISMHTTLEMRRKGFSTLHDEEFKTKVNIALTRLEKSGIINYTIKYNEKRWKISTLKERIEYQRNEKERLKLRTEDETTSLH